jgi:hypothetical protein
MLHCRTIRSISAMSSFALAVFCRIGSRLWWKGFRRCRTFPHVTVNSASVQRKWDVMEGGVTGRCALQWADNCVLTFLRECGSLYSVGH